MNRDVILILNHFMTSELLSLYTEIQRSCAHRFDVCLLSDRTQRSIYRRGFGERPLEFRFTRSDLETLDYPGKRGLAFQRPGLRNMTLGNAELPVILFGKHYPKYQRLWVIEYDVRYSGDWHDLFDAFSQSDADLLGTTLIPRSDCPSWHHWDSVRPANSSDSLRMIRGFFPVYRISRNALEYLDQSYRSGSTGHMEGLMPTLLFNGGYSIEDIGGDGPFVAEGCTNRFYTNTPSTNQLTPGTFVYRPAMQKVGEEPDMLWHPVKPAVRLESRILRRALTMATRFFAA